MAIQFVRYDGAEDFRSATEPFLMQREVENCLILGLSDTIVSGGEVAPPGTATPGFYAVTDG